MAATLNSSKTSSENDALIDLSCDSENNLVHRPVDTICVENLDSDEELQCVREDLVCLTALEIASPADDVVCLSDQFSPVSSNSTVPSTTNLCPTDCSINRPASGDGIILSVENNLQLQNAQLKVQLQALKKQIAKSSHIAMEPQVPKYWVMRDKHGRRQRSQDIGISTSSVQILQLSTSSPEFRTVLERFRKCGMPDAEVSAIRRVNNQTLWSRFARRRNEIALEISDEASKETVHRITYLHDIVAGVDARAMGKPGSSLGPAKERYLFHGACSETIQTITEEGFDFRVANLAGAMGACTYFADQASYSHTYSSTPSPNLHQRGHLWGARQPPRLAAPAPPAPESLLKMLLCRVVLGYCGLGRPGLRRPPKMANGRLFHSVSNNPAQCPDCHSKGCMFGIFDKDMAYPEYVIEYRQSSTSQMQTALAMAMGTIAAVGNPWGRPSISTRRQKKRRRQ